MLLLPKPSRKKSHECVSRLGKENARLAGRISLLRSRDAHDDSHKVMQTFTRLSILDHQSKVAVRVSPSP